VESPRTPTPHHRSSETHNIPDIEAFIHSNSSTSNRGSSNKAATAAVPATAPAATAAVPATAPAATAAVPATTPAAPAAAPVFVLI